MSVYLKGKTVLGTIDAGNIKYGNTNVKSALDNINKRNIVTPILGYIPITTTTQTCTLSESYANFKYVLLVFDINGVMYGDTLIPSIWLDSKYHNIKYDNNIGAYGIIPLSGTTIQATSVAGASLVFYGVERII